MDFDETNPRKDLPYDAMGDYSNLECYKILDTVSMTTATAKITEGVII